MKRTALRRSGLGASSREYMKRLHTAVVMLRADAVLFPGASRGRSWQGVCAHCFKTRWLVTSHILPVGHYPSVRYDPDNAIAMCSPCHIFWWHRNPFEAVAFACRKLGEDIYDRLKARVEANRRDGVTASSYMLLLMDEWQVRTGKPYVDGL